MIRKGKMKEKKTNTLPTTLTALINHRRLEAQSFVLKYCLPAYNRRTKYYYLCTAAYE